MTKHEGPVTARINELERENAELRETLKKILVTPSHRARMHGPGIRAGECTAPGGVHLPGPHCSACDTYVHGTWCVALVSPPATVSASPTGGTREAAYGHTGTLQERASAIDNARPVDERKTEHEASPEVSPAASVEPAK